VEPIHVEEDPASLGASGPSPASTLAGEGEPTPQQTDTGKPLVPKKLVSLVLLFLPSTFFLFCLLELQPWSLFGFLSPSSGIPLADQMDVDTAIGEIAKDAAAEADRIAADEAAKTAQDEATKGTAEGTSQGTGDHTDGIPATGAPGATPAAEPPAADETVAKDQPSTSDVPPSSRYLRVGDNLFVSLPGTASTRAPSEGEFFDEEVLAAAGLKIVDEPRTSGGSKEEQHLLAINDNFQKLQALHRGRKESLDSKAAVVEATEANF
jgi:hypothetical protein